MIFKPLVSLFLGMGSRHLALGATLYGDAVPLATAGGVSAYPRANYLANDHILGAYTAFPPGTVPQQQLTLATSFDNGDSWNFTGTAASKPLQEGCVDNPYPLQLPSGRVLLAFRNHDKNSRTGAWTIYRITLSYSDDLGANWKFLSDAIVVDATAQKNGVWEPFLRNAQNGKVQLYYSRELADNVQINAMMTSSDGGLSWSKETTVSAEQNSRDGMVGVTELSKESLLAVFESNDNGYPFSINIVSSTNNGQTWGDRRQIYAPQNRSKNAGAPQIVKVGNMLVVSFMTDEDNSQATTWPDGAVVKLLFSADGGKNWVVGNRPVFPGNASWPGLLTLKDEKSFLYLAGRDSVKSQKIIL